MDFRELRSLVSLAHSGSIKRAADEIHLTPPAVHKQLKTLEAELGERLYERAGRRLRLTPPAETLLPYFREILAQYNAAVGALGDLRGAKRGFVRLAAGPTIGSFLLPHLLQQFLSRLPGVQFSLEIESTLMMAERLAAGSIDVALLVLSELSEQPPLELGAFDAAWNLEMVLACGMPDVPARCSIRELRTFPFILYNQESRMNSLMQRYFAELGFRPRVALTCNNSETIKAILMKQLGISMLPAWAVIEELRDGRLRLVRQKERPLIVKVGLLSRKTGYVPPAVKVFVEIAQRFQPPTLEGARPGHHGRSAKCRF